MNYISQLFNQASFHERKSLKKKCNRIYITDAAVTANDVKEPLKQKTRNTDHAILLHTPTSVHSNVKKAWLYLFIHVTYNFSGTELFWNVTRRTVSKSWYLGGFSLTHCELLHVFVGNFQRSVLHFPMLTISWVSWAINFVISGLLFGFPYNIRYSTYCSNQCTSEMTKYGTVFNTVYTLQHKQGSHRLQTLHPVCNLMAQNITTMLNGVNRP